MGASEESDVKKAEDRLERKADDLQRRGDEVGEQIKTARDEWQRKRSDPAVPGAAPPEDPDESAVPSTDSSGEPDGE
jgi:hypothetical protein